MPDLDDSIKEWRRQMIAGGVKSPQLLDELESHLREEIARHAHSGADLQSEFDSAVERIGSADALQTEFAKAGQILLPEMKWMTVLLAVFFAALMVLPLLWLREDQQTLCLVEYGLLSLMIAFLAKLSSRQRGATTTMTLRQMVLLQLWLAAGAVLIRLLPGSPMVGLIFSIVVTAVFALRLGLVRSVSNPGCLHV